MGEETGIPNGQMRIPGRCSYVNSEGEFLGCKSGEHYVEEHGDQWPVKRIKNDADKCRRREVLTLPHF